MTESMVVSQEVQNQFATLRQEYNKLAMRINEIDTERSEYDIVLNTIKKLNKDRRCFRLVGTALVEHTIGDVQPTLQEHRDKLEKIVKGLLEELKKKEEAMNKFALKHGLIRQNEPLETNKTEGTTQSKDSSGSTGLLV